jgi:CRISPR/Cas system-associated protein Csm6
LTTTFTAQQSRVDALVRLLGLVVLVFGAAMVYYTYSNANAVGVAPEIVTINYALGLLLLVVGLLATFAKFK